METAQLAEEGRQGAGPIREAIGNVAKRRLGRRARRAVRGRIKGFERGTRFGFMLRDNPRRTLLGIFALGAVIGAVGITLAEIAGEYSDSLESGLEEETPEMESAVG